MEIFYFILIIAIYFLPYIIAKKNNHKNSDAILLLNIFVGWTGLGWLLCLVWSVMK